MRTIDIVMQEDCLKGVLNISKFQLALLYQSLALSPEATVQNDQLIRNIGETCSYISGPQDQISFSSPSSAKSPCRPNYCSFLPEGGLERNADRSVKRQQNTHTLTYRSDGGMVYISVEGRKRSCKLFVYR